MTRFAVAALPRGSMLAVRLPEEEVRALLPESLDIATLNAPGLTVVAGPEELITDFAATMEAAGHSPLLLPGHTHNVKVTYPEDFQLAEAILSLRAQQTNKDELCKLP